MALPPDPIDELLPEVDACAIAVVEEILFRGKQEFVPNPEEPDTVDIPRDLPEQVAMLTIKEVLFGDLVLQGETVEVFKPPGDYVLREGVEGPFLLYQDDEDERPVIAGRYGPDSYSPSVLKSAIKRHNLS